MVTEARGLAPWAHPENISYLGVHPPEDTPRVQTCQELVSGAGRDRAGIERPGEPVKRSGVIAESLQVEQFLWASETEFLACVLSRRTRCGRAGCDGEIVAARVRAVAA